MKTLALDFDGVISDTIQSWVNQYNLKYSADLSKDFITHRNIDKWGFYEDLGIDLNECFEIFGRAWSDWRNLEPMERHLHQKTKMLNNLINTDIVTSVQPEYTDNIKKWLEREHIIYGDLVHSNEKEKLDYDIYIDDAGRNAVKCLEADKTALLYNQAWNRNIPNTFYIDEGTGKKSEIRRVYNLYHAIDVIREMI